MVCFRDAAVDGCGVYLGVYIVLAGVVSRDVSGDSLTDRRLRPILLNFGLWN